MKRRIVPIVVLTLAFAAIFATLYVSGARPKMARRDSLAKSNPQPEVEITGPLVYNFGKMPQMQTDSHAWEVKNVGDVDLVLWVESTTSDCTIGKLSTERDTAGIEAKRARLKPRETTRIQVQWRTKNFLNQYSKACVIGTNDPARPIFGLVVKGLVYAADQGSQDGA